MEKLKRYAGFFIALALLVIGFLPVGPNPHYDKAASLTPLDNTVLSLATTGNSLMLFWLRASDNFVACPPFVQRSNKTWQTSCNSILDIVAWLPLKNQAEFKKIDPGSMAIVEKYVASRGQVSTSKEFTETKTVENELRVGTGVSKYLESKRSSLAVQRYVLHLGWVSLCGLLFVWRRQVGGLIFFPIALLTGAAGVGAKAAKSMHDRI